MNIFDFIQDALSGTPLWVWGVLVYLIYVGVKATQDRVVYLPKLFIVPLVLIALKYKIFVSGDVTLLVSYFLAFALALAIGYVAGSKTEIKILKETKSVVLPGNYQTLTLLILFFCIKYVFGYIEDTHPTMAAEYSLLETILSALFSGYFMGRTIFYTWKFIKVKE